MVKISVLGTEVIGSNPIMNIKKINSFKGVKNIILKIK